MYQYGGTYGADCDRSILEFSTEYANNTTKHAQLTGLQTPSLKAVRADPLVKERLDMFGSDRPVKHATFGEQITRRGSSSSCTSWSELKRREWMRRT